jgi:hypothetical protein
MSSQRRRDIKISAKRTLKQILKNQQHISPKIRSLYINDIYVCSGKIVYVTQEDGQETASFSRRPAMKSNIDFLLDSDEPWTVYNTLTELLMIPKENERALKARSDMLSHPMILSLLDELKGWPGKVISSHKSAGQLYHKLSFLAYIGLKVTDEAVFSIVQRILKYQSAEGIIRLPVVVPVHFGGSGREETAWALCDAPLILYSIGMMGMKYQEGVKKAVEYLIGLSRENGWPCAVSDELGRFRGPGRKEDPCLYATLLMLKLISLYDDLKESNEAYYGTECLLDLFHNSRTLHPYMFYAGTDFRKLKVPNIWYDILHTAYILSQFTHTHTDSRFKEMLGLINSKADKDGLFTPESEWRAWSAMGLGSKKRPSPWLTYQVYSINNRII